MPLKKALDALYTRFERFLNPIYADMTANSTTPIIPPKDTCTWTVDPTCGNVADGLVSSTCASTYEMKADLSTPSRTRKCIWTQIDFQTPEPIAACTAVAAPKSDSDCAEHSVLARCEHAASAAAAAHCLPATAPNRACTDVADNGSGGAVDADACNAKSIGLCSGGDVQGCPTVGTRLGTGAGVGSYNTGGPTSTKEVCEAMNAAVAVGACTGPDTCAGVVGSCVAAGHCVAIPSGPQSACEAETVNGDHSTGASCVWTAEGADTAGSCAGPASNATNSNCVAIPSGPRSTCEAETVHGDHSTGAACEWTATPCTFTPINACELVAADTLAATCNGASIPANQGACDALNATIAAQCVPDHANTACSGVANPTDQDDCGVQAKLAPYCMPSSELAGAGLPCLVTATPADQTACDAFAVGSCAGPLHDAKNSHCVAATKKPACQAQTNTGDGTTGNACVWTDTNACTFFAANSCTFVPDNTCTHQPQNDCKFNDGVRALPGFKAGARGSCDDHDGGTYGDRCSGFTATGDNACLGDPCVTNIVKGTWATVSKCAAEYACHGQPCQDGTSSTLLSYCHVVENAGKMTATCEPGWPKARGYTRNAPASAQMEDLRAPGKVPLNYKFDANLAHGIDGADVLRDGVVLKELFDDVYHRRTEVAAIANNPFLWAHPGTHGVEPNSEGFIVLSRVEGVANSQDSFLKACSSRFCWAGSALLELLREPEETTWEWEIGGAACWIDGKADFAYDAYDACELKDAAGNAVVGPHSVYRGGIKPAPFVNARYKFQEGAHVWEDTYTAEVAESPSVYEADLGWCTGDDSILGSDGEIDTSATICKNVGSAVDPENWKKHSTEKECTETMYTANGASIRCMWAKLKDAWAQPGGFYSGVPHRYSCYGGHSLDKYVAQSPAHLHGKSHDASNHRCDDANSFTYNDKCLGSRPINYGLFDQHNAVKHSAAYDTLVSQSNAFEHIRMGNPEDETGYSLRRRGYLAALIELAQNPEDFSEIGGESGLESTTSRECVGTPCQTEPSTICARSAECTGGCDDGDPNTFGETCSGQIWSSSMQVGDPASLETPTQIPNVCGNPTTTCYVGNPGAAACDADPRCAGISCDDGDASTSGTTCQSGTTACSGGVAVPTPAPTPAPTSAPTPAPQSQPPPPPPPPIRLFYPPPPPPGITREVYAGLSSVVQDAAESFAVKKGGKFPMLVVVGFAAFAGFAGLLFVVAGKNKHSERMSLDERTPLIVSRSPPHAPNTPANV